MKENFFEIIRLIKKYSELSNSLFNNENEIIKREQIEEILDKRCEKLRDIASDVSDLISKNLTPYINDPSKMTPQLAEEFEEFSELLSNYSEKIDTGLSYEIRNALVKYSRIINDDELYIRNLFFKGLCLLFLRKTLFHNQMAECYDEIISFAPRYATFSKPIRNIIVRAFGNRYVSVMYKEIYDFFECVDNALDFWKNTAEKIDPDFGWENIYLNAEQNICTVSASYIRFQHDDFSIDPLVVSKFYKSSKYVYEYYVSRGEKYHSLALRYRYFYELSQYYSRMISAFELSNTLYEIFSSADTSSYSDDNLFKTLQMSALYLYYLARVDSSELSESAKQDKSDYIEKIVYNYLSNAPAGSTQSIASYYLPNFAVGMFQLYDSFEFLRVVLNLTVFRHKPTFTHSLLVAKISSLIIRYLIIDNPESLVGINGLNSLEDVNKHAENIEFLTWFAGLAHDVGKISYTDMISIYVRKLTDSEFKLIKEHPNSIFHELYTNYTMFEEAKHAHSKNIHEDHVKVNFGFLREYDAFWAIVCASLGHHKSYDGKSGYPVDVDNSTSGVKPIIDIVTIADCIDAATDNVGRSYAKGKTLDQVLDEFVADSGTKYSPVIVDLIKNNKDLYKHINIAINKYRFDIYHACFNITKLPDKIFSLDMLKDDISSS